jgi:hypothetical protein
MKRGKTKMAKRLITEGDDPKTVFSYTPEGHAFRADANSALWYLVNKWVDDGYSPYEMNAIVMSALDSITARKIVYDVRKFGKTKDLTKEEATVKVSYIDMNLIWDRLVKVNGFEAKRADKAVRMYRKYLTLMVMYPDVLMSPPSSDTDEAWHAHILHTQKYADDCNTLFGKFRHHNPMPHDNPIQQEADKMIKKLWDENGMSHG